MTEETKKYVEVTPEQKKKFAQEQLKFLRDKGVTNKKRLSRIFKAAGPGQVQEAWKLANCEDWTTPDGMTGKDLLDCLLTGMHGSQKFGLERMKKVLEEAGFYVPQVTTSSAFFRALQGALEILIPGSYNFTKEELESIMEGIQKSEEKYSEGA